MLTLPLLAAVLTTPDAIAGTVDTVELDGTVVVNPRAAEDAPPLETRRARLALPFEDGASLYDVMTFLAEELRIEIAVDRSDVPRMKQVSVALSADRPVLAASAWAAFEHILHSQFFALRVGGSRATIVDDRDRCTLPDRGCPPETRPPASEVRLTWLVELERRPVNDALGALFTAPDASFGSLGECGDREAAIAYAPTNLLIVSGAPSNVRAMVRAAEAPDTP